MYNVNACPLWAPVTKDIHFHSLCLSELEEDPRRAFLDFCQDMLVYHALYLIVTSFDRS